MSTIFTNHHLLSPDETLNAERVDCVDRLLRKAAVLEATGLTQRSLENKVRAGTFPKPVLLDARQVAWPASEVAAWIERLKTERDTGVKTPERLAIEAARRRGGMTAAQKRSASRSPQHTQ